MNTPPPSSADATLPAPQPAPTPPPPGDEIVTRAPEGSSDQPAAGLPRFAGYSILSELGRGGMGVVYRAIQAGLNRPVALKMILAGEYAGGAERERFRREAEAVARLCHPNIVQVHEVGEVEGRLFFSLEFLEGGSLAERLGGKPQPPGTAARIVRSLAEAVQHAHEHGIVHRDLKPANILLAGSADLALELCVPKVADFGLAKRLEQEAGQTRSGAVVGTPSYMAPEQAEGKSREVGPAADVWALGVILYEMLLGRPPFQAATAMDTILQVVSEEAAPPRRLNPSVPRDLEVICLKCLEKIPARRYAKAQELADDLRRYLNGEPIHARPASAWERAWKWTRRRPALAALLLVCVVAVLALLGGSWWYSGRLQRERDYALAQRDEATRAREEAERQQRHARSRLRQLVGAVDSIAQVTPERLSLVGAQMTEERRQRLRDALRLCRGFLEEVGDDPAERQAAGQTWTRVAVLHLLLAEMDKAAEPIRRAVELQRRLTDTYPDRQDYKYDLSRSRLVEGHLHLMSGRVVEARTAYEDALQQLGRVAAKSPEDARCQQALAEGHRHLAALYLRLNQMRTAELHFRQDLARYEGLARRYPKDPEYKYQKAVGQSNLAAVLHTAGHLRDAEKTYRQSVDDYEQTARAHPNTGKEFRAVLVQSYLGLARLCRQQKRPAEAERYLRAGFASAEQVVRDFPEVVDHALPLLGVLAELAPYLKTKPAELLGLCDRVRPPLEEAARSGQVRPVARLALAVLCGIRGDSLILLDRCEEALKDWKQAAELGRGAVLEGALRLGLARARAKAGDWAAALAEAEEVLKRNSDGDHLFRAGVVHAEAAQAVGCDERLALAERQRRAEEFAARAVELLGKGLDAGLTLLREEGKTDALRDDPGLRKLLTRADFRKLLATWEEFERLEGTWSIVAGEYRGKPDKEALKFKVTFSGNRFTVQRGETVEVRGSLRLDPSASPRHMDASYSGGPHQGKTRPGIYEWKGDRLRIGYADIGHERPTVFSSTTGGGILLFEYRRDQP
jgi:uncharacterized protein (TIGR03067 family)